MIRPESKDITVVVQGPVFGGPQDPPERRLTARVLESIRRHLPGSPVILSTWRGQNTTDLDLDPSQIIYNIDPGGFPTHAPRPGQPAQLNNVNRQIVSTHEGLKRVQTPFALKLRPDLELQHAGFLDFFGRYPAFNPELRAVGSRFITCQFFARNPRSHARMPFQLEMPFHPSDWVFFGRTADLQNLWDIPLMQAEDQTWFSQRPQPSNIPPRHRVLYRYAPEQWIWLSFLRKHAPVICEHLGHIDAHILRQSELSLANNLVILTLEQFGIKSLKVDIPTQMLPWQIYTHHAWRELYRHYCDPDHVVSRFDRERAKMLAWLVPAKVAVVLRRELTALRVRAGLIT